MDYPRIGRRRWLFVSLSLNPIIALLAYAAMSAAGESLPRPAPLTPGILVLFVFFFIGALGEELGWSGYATEPLERRWGILHAGLLLGAIWAAWHFVPLAQADRSVSWIASWSVGTIALRTLMVWLYFRSGRSVFATTIFHAMTNLSWQLFPVHGSHYDPFVVGAITVTIAIVVYVVQCPVTAYRSRSS